MDEDARARQEHLQQLVQSHRVRWEVHGVDAKPMGGERLRVGFEVTLAGVFDPSIHEAASMRERYEVVSAALREVAEDLLEHGGDPAVRELDIYDPGEQLSHARPDRFETSLKVSILHPGERPEPPDDALNDCLKEMEARLRELGAQKGHWHEEAR